MSPYPAFARWTKPCRRPRLPMDIHFCQHYQGDGHPESNKYCRGCPKSDLACDHLWQLVRDLSDSNGAEGVSIPSTNATLLPNVNNEDTVYLKVNAKWQLPKEDFLHFIATGWARGGNADQRQDSTRSPSLTYQGSYLPGIEQMLGGDDIPEIQAVRKMQGKA